METRVRRIMAWVLVVAGVAMATTSIVRGFAEDPPPYGGWGAAVAEAVFMGLPLVIVGLALRSDRPVVRRRTAIAALALAALAAFVFVMQLADPNEITSDRIVSALGLAFYSAAALLEVRAIERTPDRTPDRTRDPPVRGRPWGSPGVT